MSSGTPSGQTYVCIAKVSIKEADIINVIFVKINPSVILYKLLIKCISPDDH